MGIWKAPLKGREDLLRNIPSVDDLLKVEAIDGLIKVYSRIRVVDALRETLSHLREGISSGEIEAVYSPNWIAAEARSRLERALSPSLRCVVNATGVVLHTNLGRAILCDKAVERLSKVASQPVNLEYDLEKGRRGERDSHTEDLICQLTGAEEATVVNNNAAAVFIALNTLAEGKEVIISRGELVEIGGSFRLPEIIQKSGCRRIEVGTTNQTHPSDYISAISPDTTLLLKVHTSNYKIVGFSSSVDLRELVTIGKEFNIPVVEDLGSGSLVDLSLFGLPKEPIVRERIEAGADVVTFSGDKLLGGPQAGVIVGKAEYIKKIKKNPLKRALRVDKLILVALEATLRLYLNLDVILEKLPTLRFLTRPVEEIEQVAKVAAATLKKVLGNGYTIEVEDGESQVGSGSLPEEVIPTKVISIVHKALPPERIFEIFLKNEPPIIGRVYREKFLLDMRMIYEIGDVVPASKKHIEVAKGI